MNCEHLSGIFCIFVYWMNTWAAYLVNTGAFALFGHPA